MIQNLSQSPAVTNSLLAIMRNAGEFTVAPTTSNHTAKRRLIARAVRATNVVLAALGTPDNVYRFLVALIGLSRGQLQFEASDADIGREVFADRRETNTLKMWAKRSRKAIEKWQDRTGYRIVIISPGGRRFATKPDGSPGHEYGTTEYELPLLDAIAKVARSRSMQQAAEGCLYDLLNDSRKATRERFENRPRTKGEAMMQRCQKAALTYAEKMCVEALNMHPMGTPRDKALAEVEERADAFAHELKAVMREFARTGQTREQRAENARLRKAKSLKAQKMTNVG